MKNIRKIYIISGIAAIALITFFRGYRTQNYNASFPVMIYSDSAQNYEINGTESTLHIVGTIKRTLFRPDTFSGEIWIDGMEDMRNSDSKQYKIEQDHMDYNFTVGQEDANALSSLYNATLYWDSEIDLFALQVYEKNRNNYTLDGWIAVGPYSPEKTDQQIESEEGILGRILYEDEITYSEWDLKDAFYNGQTEEFVFLQQSLDKAIDTYQIAQNTNTSMEENYPLHVHFINTGLAFDHITVKQGEDAKKSILIPFRFRSYDSYKSGLTEFKTAFQTLPANVKVYDMPERILYEVQNTNRTSSLTLLPMPAKYQINVVITSQEK